MAQMTLTAVGSALGGPIGAFVGSVVGAFIDQAIFGQDMKGPRLTDLTVTSSAYGTPIPLIYGPENRIAGNVIWSTGLIETPKKKKAGKGGPSVTTYSYSTSLAVLLSANELTSLKQIFANGKKIFDIADATVAPAAPTTLVGMVATRANGTHAVFDTVRFYQGNGTQQIDPTIEANLGSGNAPAFRWSAYVVLTGLQLADFGNGVPNLEFVLDGYPSDQVGDWVADIRDRAGIDALDMPVGLSDTGRGFVIASQMTAFAAIEPLGLAYNFDLAEQAGTIRLVKRGGAIRATIPVDDMGAVQGDVDIRPEPMRIETEPPQKMPREVTVTYADPDLDFQPNSQRASRQLGDSANNVTRELPLVLSATESRRIADMLLWDGWASRRTTRLQLSDRWHGLAPGHVVGLPLGPYIAPFKLQRMTRGANGVHEIEARMADPDAYLSDGIGIAGTLIGNPLQLPGPTRLQLMDAPLLRDADDSAGFYWAVAGENAGWRGADILRSSDSGVTYVSMSEVAVRSVIGDVAAPLAAGPADYWDRGNVITVVLHYDDDELESVAESAVLNGANAFWLGGADGQDGEIIQFATATLISPGTYELSDLLRGRQGTDHLIGSHGTNEVFVLLEPDALGRSDYGAGDWDKARLYKPVSVLETEADTASQSFTNEGEAKMPLSPVGVSGARDGSNNLTIAWHRRSRLSGAGLFGGDPPLGEDVEAYEIDILVASVVVRTLTSATASVAYSAAEQTSDGITPGDPVTGDIYQMSGSRGRGHARRFTV